MFRIGNATLSSNLFLAPIAGYCDLAFRLTIRPIGGLGMASTDLVNPRGLLRATTKSMQLVETNLDDRPLCIQLYGCEAAEMAAAAQWGQEHGATLIDINMGCPVDKVCKKDGGSALLRNTDSAAALARQVVDAVQIPVTVKMRLGWDDESIVAPLLARRLEDEGVAAITIHGRTAAQKFSGTVRIEPIARVVEAVRRIPVLGNGDIRSPQDAKAMMDRTGCTGVMIGRAALSDPWIFRDTQTFLTTGEVPAPPTVFERIALMTQHFENLIRIRGEHLACVTFRQRASWYTRYFGRCDEFKKGVRALQTAAEYYELVNSLIETVENNYNCPMPSAIAGVLV